MLRKSGTEDIESGFGHPKRFDPSGVGVAIVEEEALKP